MLFSLQGTCGACGVPIDPGRLIPNLAIRVAAAAFQAEESLGLKRARDGDLARGMLPFIRVSELVSMKQYGFQGFKKVKKAASRSFVARKEAAVFVVRNVPGSLSP